MPYSCDVKHTKNCFTLSTIWRPGLKRRQSTISLEVPVGHPTIVANFLAFSSDFSTKTHGLSAVPLCDIPRWNNPRNGENKLSAIKHTNKHYNHKLDWDIAGIMNQMNEPCVLFKL